ncbi:MAG: LptA/OstA family protein [Cyanophyceae cyanobacterium]
MTGSSVGQRGAQGVLTRVTGSLLVGMVGMMAMAGASVAQDSRALTIRADSQEANANTGVVTAQGNVTISYPAEQVTARSQRLTYYTREQRIVLEGGVSISQEQNQLQAETVTYLVEQGTISAEPAAGQQVETIYVFPDPPSADPETPEQPGP